MTEVLMLAGFILSLREGLEAALIIGVLMGALTKIHQERLLPAVWLGTAVAAGLSLVASLLLHALGSELEGSPEIIFEGSTMLFASALLTWMIFWMGRQARSLKNNLESDVRRALVQGGAKALFLLAFFSVVREGLELALYLTATTLAGDQRQVLAGSLIGLFAAILLGASLFASLVRLDLRRFFTLTGILLVLFAAGMVAHGMQEFIEIGWIPPLVPHIWNTNFLLNEKSVVGQMLNTLFGYNGSPSLVEMIAYLAYFAVVGVGSLLDRRLPARSKTA
jgi:high-affinity iron transporter